ncbi:MAG TPA: hypothetical protein VN702_17820 [Acetobacteraceae bacterium]|nr:hypothetical protein [Acetobacteraceae bacterium]
MTPHLHTHPIIIPSEEGLCTEAIEIEIDDCDEISIRVERDMCGRMQTQTVFLSGDALDEVIKRLAAVRAGRMG